MRNHFLDILPVRSSQSPKRNIFIPYAYFESFAHQALDQLNLRTLAQIVGAGLEAQSQLRNFLFACAQHHFHGAINVFGVARHQGFEQGQLKIEFFGFISNRAQILGQAGSAKCETRRQISWRICSAWYQT